MRDRETGAVIPGTEEEEAVSDVSASETAPEQGTETVAPTPAPASEPPLSEPSTTPSTEPGTVTETSPAPIPPEPVMASMNAGAIPEPAPHPLEGFVAELKALIEKWAL